MLNHGWGLDKCVKRSYIYTPDNGLTDTYSTVADGRSFVCSRFSARMQLYHCRHNARDRQYDCNSGISKSKPL